MKLKRIKNNEDIKPFDCGDADYNGFLPITKHTRLMFFDMNELY